MTFMCQRLLLIFLLLSVSVGVSAKDKSHALGLRGGISSGFEYRYYLGEQNSIKFLVSSRDRGFQLHGLYEIHAKGLFDFSNRLTFIYGGGIHAGYESWHRAYYIGHTRYTEPVSRPLAGLDFLAALEYPFIIFPFSIGLEVKPYVDFWGKNFVKVQPFDFAFTFKFHF
jgi:hypothetical protein